MNRKSILAVVVLTVIIAAVSFGFLAKVTHAQEQGADQVVLAKLDQVLQGQKAIIDQMAALKQELNIIKIRITQAQ